MNKILGIASLVLVAGALQAQSTSMKVTDVITAQANKVTQSFKKNQVIKTYGFIQARDGGTRMRSKAAASKMLRIGRSGHSGGRHGGSGHSGSMATISDHASAQAGTNTASVSGKGKVEVVFTTTGKGTLVLNYFGRAVNGKGGVSVTGFTTFTATADGKRHTKKVTITKAGKYTLLVDSAASAKALSKAGAYVSGSFSALLTSDSSSRKVTITKGKASCKEGGVLSGSARSYGMGHSITLDLKGSLANAFAINLISSSSNTGLLPGSKTCNLLLKPTWAGMARTDRSGNASTHLRHSFRRAATLYDQMVTLSFGRGGLKLVSSNQVKIVIQ